MLLLSDDAKGCILLANRECKEMLQSNTMAAHPRPLIGGCLFKWFDVPDMWLWLFHAAISKCLVFGAAIHTVA
jgi:hypothetical protein